MALPVQAIRVAAAACSMLAMFCLQGCGKGSSPSAPSSPTAASPPATIDELASTARTPDQLLSWMRANIAYYAPASMNEWRYWSPQEVFADRKGDCITQSGFASYILTRNGYNCRLIFIQRYNNTDHAVCAWTGSDGKLRFIENSFGGHYGIHGPYDSVNQIATQVYDWLVAYDGKTATYEVRDFTDVPFGIDWETFLRSGLLLYTVF